MTGDGQQREEDRWRVRPRWVVLLLLPMTFALLFAYERYIQDETAAASGVRAAVYVLVMCIVLLMSVLADRRRRHPHAAESACVADS